jgi:hypothetical protein
MKRPAPHAKRLILALGALGVVFGDIGTSPLYTLSECLGHLGKGPFQPTDVLGLLSLVVWSLTLVVSVKYLIFGSRDESAAPQDCTQESQAFVGIIHDQDAAASYLIRHCAPPLGHRR